MYTNYAKSCIFETVDVERIYGYARKISGALYMDLAHHCILKVQGKDIKNIETYLFRVMKNEFCDKRSSFNKIYGAMEHCEDMSNAVDISDDELYDYEGDKVNEIINEVEQEHPTEIGILKLSMQISIREIEKKSTVHRRTLIKICNLAKSEIRKKYDRVRNN